MTIYISIIGTIAAILTTSAMMPQAWKIFKTNEVSQLSLRTFTMATVGTFLWLIYGLLILDTIIIWANAIGVFVNGYIWIKKIQSHFNTSKKPKLL
jgi:MtN3 and saliva related transmembrane protein